LSPGRFRPALTQRATAAAVPPIVAGRGTERSWVAGGAPGRVRTFWSDTWRALRRDRAALVGLAMIALFVGAAAVAPVVAPFDPNRGFAEGLDDRGYPVPPLSPGPPGQPAFLLGTDGLGRDIL